MTPNKYRYRHTIEDGIDFVQWDGISQTLELLENIWGMKWVNRNGKYVCLSHGLNIPDIGAYFMRDDFIYILSKDEFERHYEPVTENLSNSTPLNRSNSTGLENGWLPIESAPKEDGEFIQTCVAGSKIPFIASWDSIDEEWVTFNRHYEIYIRQKWEPTHWKHIDNPPPTQPKGEK